MMTLVDTEQSYVESLRTLIQVRFYIFGDQIIKETLLYEDLLHLQSLPGSN